MPPRASAALLCAVLSVAPGPAVARFIPPEGQVLRQVLIEERSEPGPPQRFTTERELVFARTATGFAVTVTVLRADPDASDSGAMFGAAMAGLRGQPIVFQLDVEGRLVAIDDEVKVWTRLRGAIAAMATNAPPPRTATTADFGNHDCDAGTVVSRPAARDPGVDDRTDCGRPARRSPAG